MHRIPFLLRRRCGIRYGHDISRCSYLWSEEPPDILIDMLRRRLYLRNGNQGIRYRYQTHVEGRQPIQTSIDLRFRHRHTGLHFSPNELFQQSLESIHDQHVRFQVQQRGTRKADQRSVNPLYYVTFTTATICASFILFGGFNTTDAVNTLSLLCGFLVIFTGVYLLNLSREDPEGHQLLSNAVENGIPTDGMSGITTRHSMQLRRSGDGHYRNSSGSINLSAGDRDRLIHNYDTENGVRLHDIGEDSDDENGKRTSFDGAFSDGKSASKQDGPRRPSRALAFR